MLAFVYDDGFTERLETKDSQEAEALLTELAEGV
jgi:hypothetical protein